MAEQAAPPCRSSWYTDTGHRQHPGDREVRCGLPAGHEGDHDEMIDGEPGASWPQRFEVGVHFGCPKCRTILNAEAAGCDGPWHSDNRPTDPWLEAVLVAAVRAVRFEPWDDRPRIVGLIVAHAMPAMLLGIADEIDADPFPDIPDDMKRIFAAWLRDRAGRLG